MAEEINEYEQKANEFMASTGTTMSVGAPVRRKHFSTDTVCRYVFPVTLRRGSESMRIKFGQSYANGKTEPTAYEVLAPLTKYDVGSFDDFCACFGYDTDSRSAYSTYRNVRREWEAVKRLWGDCLPALEEIA